MDSFRWNPICWCRWKSVLVKIYGQQHVESVVIDVWSLSRVIASGKHISQRKDRCRKRRRTFGEWSGSRTAQSSSWWRKSKNWEGSVVKILPRLSFCIVSILVISCAIWLIELMMSWWYLRLFLILFQDKCHQYWPEERSARYQYFVVDPVAQYNMPLYILREFKVTDARVMNSRLYVI